MKKIDIHHHLVEEEGYVSNLLSMMDRFNIERVFLIGMGRYMEKLFVINEPDGSCANSIL